MAHMGILIRQGSDAHGNVGVASANFQMGGRTWQVEIGPGIVYEPGFILWFCESTYSFLGA